jgi:hypothetical protein
MPRSFYAAFFLCRVLFMPFQASPAGKQHQTIERRSLLKAVS